MGTSIYREAWLQKAVKAFGPMFAEVGVNLPPKVQVSVGFPGGGSARTRIGECWHANAAGDKVPHIFISPMLHEPVIVLATLAHELVHAQGAMGHGADFRNVAVGIGLEGKMTATVPGDALIERLKKMADALGEYPHKGLTLSDRKKQSTRMLKVECVEGSGYKVRLTRTWLDEYGAPFCPCHHETMEEN